MQSLNLIEHFKHQLENNDARFRFITYPYLADYYPLI